MTTKTIIASALATGVPILGFSIDSEQPEIKLQTGYKLFTPDATEEDIQKTLVAPDSTRFSIALNLLEIQKIEEQLNAIVDEECEELADEELAECEAQNTANAEQRANIVKQQNKLLTDIASAKEELGLDIPKDNPYLE